MRQSLVLLALVCLFAVKARPLDDETGETEEEKRSKLAGVKRAKGQAKADTPPSPEAETTAAPSTTKETQPTKPIEEATNPATNAATTQAPTTQPAGTTLPPKATTEAGAGSTSPAAATTPGATTIGTTAAPATTQPVTTAPKAEEKLPEPTTATKVSEKPEEVKPTTSAPTTTKPKETKTEPTKPGGKEGEEKGKEEEKEKEKEKEKEDESDVEDSKNNTRSMTATTFHVAIRFTKEVWSDDLLYPINPVYQSLKRMLQIAIEKIYKLYKVFRQFALIRFSAGKRGGVGRRQSVPPPTTKPPATSGEGVVADFYLRFYSAGQHLTPLADQIKTGTLDTHPVSNKFVRAYTAEPKGRVCTPDCRLQCYSYCDQGCCNTMYHMQVQIPQQQQNLLPPPVPAPVSAPVAAPAPAQIAIPPPAAPTFSLPPAQPAPFPNYSPIAAPVSFASHCPPQCSSYCAQTCPNACCTSGYQGMSAPAAAPAYPAMPAAAQGYAQYPQGYQGMGGCQQGMPGCVLGKKRSRVPGAKETGDGMNLEEKVEEEEAPFAEENEARKTNVERLLDQNGKHKIMENTTDTEFQELSAPDSADNEPKLDDSSIESSVVLPKSIIEKNPKNLQILKAKDADPDKGDVENSKNNTKRMIATTFHVAIRFPKGRFSKELNNPDNQLYQSMKRMVQRGINSVYQTNPAVRQFALIKFSPDRETLSKDRRQRIINHSTGPPGTSPGVIADFYLRFYTAWKHLVPLSDAISTGKLENHEVSPKFVRAFVAESRDKPCDPDCNFQCYSYCDQSCCGKQPKSTVPEPDPPMAPVIKMQPKTADSDTRSERRYNVPEQEINLEAERKS